MSELIKRKYDLEERTSQFGIDVILFCKQLKFNPISTPLITQIVKSSTAIGANYSEANGASSKKDFQNKIYIVKKECKETKHWIRMLIACFPEVSDSIYKIRQEANELTLIFSAISKTLRNKK